MKYLITLLVVLICLSAPAQQDFITKPYLQIGNSALPQSLQLLWHTATADARWMVEYNTGIKWIKSENLATLAVTIAGAPPFTVYNASFRNLIPGGVFKYRVSKNTKVIFTAEAKAPKSIVQSYRFVASGDMGAGTKAAKQVAIGIYKANPDFVAIAGDIVYDYGLISEYKTKFWPIYNTDKPDTAGMPLMRSIPFIAAAGNHDADSRDLDKYPDALAYYLLWDQPLNGPKGEEGGKWVPLLKGSEANKMAFTNAAGDKYPRMTNFSFDYGNAHWLVLDANTYVDWTDSLLTDWVKKDLANAQNAQWRFVLYHQPGFNSSRMHFEEQQMRLLAPVFENGEVDIVFNGHVHNYQRSFPMRFEPDKKGILLVGGKENKTIRGRVVTGKWTLDKSFDGKINTKPNGVIYVISGAGGQTLYNPEQTNDPDSWQKFTDRFVSNIHSFTVVDVNGKYLQLKQVDVDGHTIDTIEIKK
jgi:acid phosphatase type 7